MKRSGFIITALLAVILCSTPAGAYTKRDVFEGRDKRETIIVQMDSGITYIAESTIGADPTKAEWVCYKIEEIELSDRTVTIITVMPQLQAPGVNGENLPIFDYPND